MFTHREIQACTRCDLHKTRTHALTGEGNLHAEVMLIAQAPGEQEDNANRMFIGPSGKILHSILKEAEIPENEVYMTNLIKCTLPKNRRPKQAEIYACSIYLDQEIHTVQPSILVPMGYYATKYLFEKYDLHQFSRKEFSNVLGKLFILEKMTVFPLSHPALLLYKKQFHDSFVQNVTALRKRMKEMK